MEVSQKLKKELLYDLEVPPLHISPNEIKTEHQRGTALPCLQQH